MSKSRMYGVEIDSISGRIAKLLYPEAHIIVCGFGAAIFGLNFFQHDNRVHVKAVSFLFPALSKMVVCDAIV